MMGMERSPPLGCFSFFHCSCSRPPTASRRIEHVKDNTSTNPLKCKPAEKNDSVAVPVVAGTTSKVPTAYPNYVNQQKECKVQEKGTRLKKSLSNMIRDGRLSRKRGNVSKEPSSNVMVLGNLGNVSMKKKADISDEVLDYLPKTAKELNEEANRSKGMADKENSGSFKEQAGMTEADELKERGNEEYKKGRYAEAVTLYNKAISKDPNKASYWSNKAAALLGLGQLLAALADCRVAVKIDPYYCRAHQRLATLYLRLGDADNAIKHYKLSGNEGSPSDMLRAEGLQTHLTMSGEAQKLKDWPTLLRLTQNAISKGADSSPKVLALQAEALLNLHRHEEADFTIASSPKFDVDAFIKFFGAASTAYFLGVRAQVDMSAGRFDDAVKAAKQAADLNPNNLELSNLELKALSTMSARLKGNALFNESRFEDACIAYGEGLGHDPCNAILLCNRAACHSKLGQWEKAIDDCNVALKYLPSYNKARLRRADCNAKLEMWEAAVGDYEVLARQMTGDENVAEALAEAHVQLKKQKRKVNGNSENDRF